MGLVSVHDEYKMTEITVWWFKYRSLIYTKSNWHRLICPLYCSWLAELQIKTLCYVKGTCTHDHIQPTKGGWITVNVCNSSSVWRVLYEFWIAGPVRIFILLIPLTEEINMFLSYLSYSLFQQINCLPIWRILVQSCCFTNLPGSAAAPHPPQHNDATTMQNGGTQWHIFWKKKV